MIYSNYFDLCFVFFFCLFVFRFNLHFKTATVRSISYQWKCWFWFWWRRRRFARWTTVVNSAGCYSCGDSIFRNGFTGTNNYRYGCTTHHQIDWFQFQFELTFSCMFLIDACALAYTLYCIFFFGKIFNLL